MLVINIKVQLGIARNKNLIYNVHIIFYSNYYIM